MNSEIEKVIKKVLAIPHDFHERKNASSIDLLNESGYLEFNELIQQENIIEILKADPNLITEWLQWSDDKRSTPTWYFTRGDDGWCFVGHSPEGNEFKEINTKDEFKACAAFIKLEAERIRLNR